MFLWFIRKKKKNIINNISIPDQTNGRRIWLIKINKELLIVPGQNKISIINVNEHKLIRIINVLNSGDIYGICLLNESM